MGGWVWGWGGGGGSLEVCRRVGSFLWGGDGYWVWGLWGGDHARCGADCGVVF